MTRTKIIVLATALVLIAGIMPASYAQQAAVPDDDLRGKGRAGVDPYVRDGDVLHRAVVLRGGIVHVDTEVRIVIVIRQPPLSGPGVPDPVVSERVWISHVYPQIRVARIDGSLVVADEEGVGI